MILILLEDNNMADFRPKHLKEVAIACHKKDGFEIIIEVHQSKTHPKSISASIVLKHSFSLLSFNEIV